MHRTCIAVVDASRARLFTYERTHDVEGLREELIEQRDLINPARRQRTADLFSDTRPGVGRSGNLQYGFDDHREEHIDKLDSEFSRVVVDELVAMLRAARTERLIMCASPRMLGELRESGDELGRNGLVIDEVPRDLVKLTPAQLRKQLTSYGLLPEPPPRRTLV